MSTPFVQATNLRRVFDVSKPWLNRVLEGGQLEYLKAVDHVTFDIKKGETFALVGESGSGKTTVARMVVGLLPPSSGDAWNITLRSRTTSQDGFPPVTCPASRTSA